MYAEGPTCKLLTHEVTDPDRCECHGSSEKDGYELQPFPGEYDLLYVNDQPSFGYALV